MVTDVIENSRAPGSVKNAEPADVHVQLVKLSLFNVKAIDDGVAIVPEFRVEPPHDSIVVDSTLSLPTVD
jgi:hypothetical protein